MFGPRRRSVRLLGLMSLSVFVLPLRADPGKPLRSSYPSPWEQGLAPKPPESKSLRRIGKKAYEARCFVCHGETGDGRGSAGAFMATKPRNFTAGKFKLRSTPWGTLPNDEDLYRTLTLGFPQYGMPSFAALTNRERWAVVYYIKGLMKKSGRRQGRTIDLGSEPPMTRESARRGKKLYRKFGCAACHGVTGTADSPLVRHFPEYYRDGEALTLPRNFKKGRLYFKSGGTPRDIVRTLVTGFEGTRMVPFTPVLDDPNDLTPLWDISHYLFQLSQGGPNEP